MINKLHWQKSSFSGPEQNCLEIAASPDGIAIRESDTPDQLIFTTRHKLEAFILGVKAGEFDRFVE